MRDILEDRGDTGRSLCTHGSASLSVYSSWEPKRYAELSGIVSASREKYSRSRPRRPYVRCAALLCELPWCIRSLSQIQKPSASFHSCVACPLAHPPLDERNELHEPDVWRVGVKVKVRVGHDQPAMSFRRGWHGRRASSGAVRQGEGVGCKRENKSGRFLARRSTGREKPEKF